MLLAATRLTNLSEETRNYDLLVKLNHPVPSISNKIQIVIDTKSRWEERKSLRSSWTRMQF